MLVVWRAGRKNSASRIFRCLLISVGVTSLLIFGMRSSPDAHEALLWDKMVAMVGYSSYVFYYHFTLAYTVIRGQRHVLLAGYLLLILFAGLGPTDLLVRDMRIEYYGYAPSVGPVFVALSVSGLFLMGAGVYNLHERYRISYSTDERNRILYLLIAPFFSVLGGLLDTFSNLPPAAIWGNLIFCILCTVAIVKYRLLDIRVVIRKSLVYILISVALAVPYAALLYALNYFLGPRAERWWIHLLVILVLAIILRPLYSWAQQSVDRFFYRDRYDYLRALEKLSHETYSLVDLESLGAAVVKLIGGALRVSNVSLLLPSEAERGFVVMASTDSQYRPSRAVLRSSSPLIRWLEREGNIFSSEQFNIVPQLQSLLLREKDILKRMEAMLFVPIRNRQGRLSGILVLGQKFSQQPYSSDDRRLLNTISNQMAMAIENVRLYAEVKQSEEKLRLVYESMTEGIAILDLDGNITQVNKSMLLMHGYSDRAELLGRRLVELVASSDRSSAKTHLMRALQEGSSGNTGLAFLRKDGSIFSVELNATVLRDAAGSTAGLVVVTRDITERKQAEENERKLQQELNLSSRMASIGELAAGVAHEINNPLTGIIGFSQRLLRKSADDTVKRDLERIHNEALRAAKVVDNLRTFARRKEPKMERSDINEILRKALELRSYELKANSIEVLTDLSPSLPSTMVDFHQIQQVFLNIILNAEQAMTEVNRNGKLIIKTEEAQGCIRISFTDEGPGISPENLDRLFTPFFTTRGERGGIGLGLSICHGIMTKHGGKIYAKSKLGEGATFFVELPLTTKHVGEGKVVPKTLGRRR